MKKNLLTPKVIYSGLFILIVLFSFIVRLHIFYAAHKGSDEMQYMGLAYKIDKYGFSNYNLKDLHVTFLEDKKLIEINNKYAENSEPILSNLPAYYNVPLFYKPPVLPFLVMLSHRMFGVSKSYFGSSDTLQGKDIQKYGKDIFAEQFYLSVFCFIVSLLGICLVFFITKYLFGTEVGLYSSFLFSITPINMMVFSRIWTDGIALCLIILAFYCYFRAKDKNSFLFACTAGVCGGLAVLTRAVALWVVPILFISELVFVLFGNRKENIRQQIKLFFVFTAVIVLLSSPWFIALYKTYGTFFYFPAKNLKTFEGNDWLTMISNRSFLVFTINPLAQNPLLVLFYVFFLRISCFKDSFVNDKNRMFKLTVLGLLFISFVLVFSVMPFKELRYILPAIFVMTVFSGVVLKAIRISFFKKTGAVQGAINMFCLFAVVAWWSVSLAKYFINANSALIQFPF